MATIVKPVRSKPAVSKKKIAAKPKGAKPISGLSKYLHETFAMPKGVKIEVSTLRTEFGISQAELARVTGYSLRSIAGWESGKPLSDSARQKLTETTRLRIALSELLSPDELGDWMRSSNPAFEGQTPIQVIERGESDRLWQMIFQIDANVAN